MRLTESIRAPLATAFLSTARPDDARPLVVVGSVYWNWTVRPFAAAQSWTFLIAWLRRVIPAVFVSELSSTSRSMRVTS